MTHKTPENNKVRTRLAPSPTGFVHIGNLRTAIYSYLIAKKSGGDFLLRLEDTDQSRFVEGAIEKIFDALNWVGIIPDEGVKGIDRKGNLIQEGKVGPYVQSERLSKYQEYAQNLIKEGKAYHCFCSPERLEDLRKKQQKEGKPPMYDKHCLSLSKEEVEERLKKGERSVIRMNVPKGEIIEFKDKVFGKISVKSETIDDQVLIKSDGFPTYHLAVVVDDHLMEITHITRGEDWLPSTPKHVLLYKFFGWEMPELIHFPNVLGENHKKLSKRQGDVSVSDFKEKGYVPEAIVNFLVLLGWNPGKGSTQEIFSLEELTKIFDVANIHKAGAVFDYKKLDWMNSYYIKQKNNEDLLNLIKKNFDDYFKKNSLKEPEKEILLKIIETEKGRAKKLTEMTENIDFYFKLPEYEKELLRWKENSDEQIAEALEKSKNVLEEIDENTFKFKEIEKKLLEAAGDKKDDLLWPLRVALTGQKQSPSPFEVAWVIGKKETLKRIKKAIEKVKENATKT